MAQGRVEAESRVASDDGANSWLASVVAEWAVEYARSRRAVEVLSSRAGASRCCSMELLDVEHADCD